MKLLSRRNKVSACQLFRDFFQLHCCFHSDFSSVLVGTVAVSWIWSTRLTESNERKVTKKAQEAESIMWWGKKQYKGRIFCGFFYYYYSKQKWIEGRKEKLEQLKDWVMLEVAYVVKLQPVFLITFHICFIYSFDFEMFGWGSLPRTWLTCFSNAESQICLSRKLEEN